MPSLFPDLFNYSFLATGVLRATLGLIFVWSAYKKFSSERGAYLEFFEKLKMRPTKIFLNIAIAVELLSGIGITAGYYTQVALFVTGTAMTFAALIKWHRPNTLPKNTIEFYIILAVLSFTLLAIGPGAFAFDLPL